MTEEKKKKESGGVSRREFLKDAGLLVGGTAIGSTVLLAACGDGDGATETVTSTKTITATEQVGEVTKTVTQTVSQFVCPSCGQEFDSLAALKAHCEAEHPSEVLEKLTKLVVNGYEHELKLEPNWTLAYVLRDKLELTGTKIACDQGVCGACTVLVDGEPTLSCMTLAIECDAKNILTVEGLQEGAELDQLQEAFVSHDAMQCGFCTSGMLMSAKALLNRDANPTKDDVKEALSGNLCRCGAYKKIIEAVMEVS